MIRISDISYPLDKSENDLKEFTDNKYKIKKSTNFGILKKSVDARKKTQIHYNYSVILNAENENELIKKFKNITPYKKKEYRFPEGYKKNKPIVIVGFGPSGMLSALMLSRNGYDVIVLERGKCVEERKEDVLKLQNSGVLNTNSNVQFGEGGAGTFSDGKLTTGINDERVGKVLEEFYLHGAPKEILYLQKPHIGTDNLFNMVRNIRKDIENSGGKVCFLKTLTDIEIEDNRVVAVIVNGSERIETNHLILACGHSARDTFKMLKEKDIKMEKKTFSVGVRIEHKQAVINKAQYGEYSKFLGAADYKLNTKTKSGRGVYTFCMCPGGEVIASTSEEGAVVTNGMSYYARDKENANAAILVNVYPEDFPEEDVLSGMYFQQELEKKAFLEGGKNYSAVCETIGHLYGGTNETNIKPSYKPSVVFSKISNVLPDFITDAIKEAIPEFNKKLNGFSDKNAVLTAPETRSSSPVRILRSSDNLESHIKGLFPCGEGAGYAGGITSAAVDGIRVAEAVAKDINI